MCSVHCAACTVYTKSCTFYCIPNSKCLKFQIFRCKYIFLVPNGTMINGRTLKIPHVCVTEGCNTYMPIPPKQHEKAVSRSVQGKVLLGDLYTTVYHTLYKWIETPGYLSIWDLLKIKWKLSFFFSYLWLKPENKSSK